MEFKLKTSLILLLAAAPAALVLAARPYPCTFNGFTLGLGLGASTFMTNNSSDFALQSSHPELVADLSIPAPISGNMPTYTNNANLYRFGGMASLFAGYGHVFEYGWLSSLYLGGEVGLNYLNAFHTAQKSTPFNNVDVTSTDFIDDVFGDVLVNSAINSKTHVSRNSLEPFIDLKLGFLVTPTMLAYLRGGINWNTIEVKTSSVYQTSSMDRFGDAMQASATLEDSQAISGIGYRAGAGFEVLMTPQIGVGADYVYSFYRKVNTSASGFGSDLACDSLEGCRGVNASINNSASSHVYDQEVMAQVIYHFV